ncbi:MAG: TIGR03936 family radical SAM-associated protein [Oscillospiraceae bacterium]|nr:TIGR03936 family radical SAM-associated protein [Oscillospiraceae bacterium]
MRLVRIWFEKKGMIRYISHLDLMRTVTRAIRRSEIPLWYTEGFNPHPYMTFSLPLSLGMESECESMDIKIEGTVTDGEILGKLKAVMPDGIHVTAVTQPVSDPKEIAYGEFTLDFDGDFDREQAKEAINGILSKDEIIIQKPGKKGHKKVMKEIDLKPLIFDPGITDTENGVRLFVRLPAGSKSNINPSLLADLIGKEIPESVCLITRKRLLTADLTEFK